MAVQVAEHRDAAGPDLVERFAAEWPRAVRARRRRPAVLRRLPIDLGIPGVPRAPLRYLLDVIYNRDLWMHRVDLARAAGHPFVVGEHDREIVAQVVRELAARWTGPPVALELTGPAGGSWTWTTSGPNARSSRRRLTRFSGNTPMLETDPLAPKALVRPSGAR